MNLIVQNITWVFISYYITVINNIMEYYPFVNSITVKMLSTICSHSWLLLLVAGLEDVTAIQHLFVCKSSDLELKLMVICHLGYNSILLRVCEIYSWRCSSGKNHIYRVNNHMDRAKITCLSTSQSMADNPTIHARLPYEWFHFLLKC